MGSLHSVGSISGDPVKPKMQLHDSQGQLVLQTLAAKIQMLMVLLSF